MRRIALPALAVVVVALAFEVAYGVSLGDALLYLGYEVGFVVLPGWATYRVLSRDPGGPLRQLAIGWALGYVLEILAFMATAATGTRPLFALYPLVVVIVAATIVRLRGRSANQRDREPPQPRWLGWLIAAVCIGAVVYIGLSYFPTSPLPGTTSVSYFPDYPRWISLAADALHHWPITDPSVAGEPLPYHYFVNIHLAAASQVTGIGVQIVYLRLFIFPLVSLSVLLMVVAGRSFTRSYQVGLLAACIAVFVGELRLDASGGFSAHTPFFGLFFTLLFRSPSFLLGLVIFIALMVLVGDRIRSRSTGIAKGEWILIILFMIGASDAKVTILPLLIAGLCVYAGWRFLVVRSVPIAVWASAAAALLTIAAVWALQYRGHSSGLELEPFGDLKLMPAVQLIQQDLIAHLAGFPGKGIALDVGAVIFGAVGLLAAQLAGIVWVLRRRMTSSLPFPEPQVWLFSLLIAGLGLTIAFAEPGTQSGLYFLFYGLVAGIVLSAQGLWSAWQSRPPIAGRWIRYAGLGIAFAVVLIALIALPVPLGLFSGPRAGALTYLLRYGGLLLALICLYLGARRLLGPTRWAAGALVSAALLTVGALATPFDNLRPAVANLSGSGASLGAAMSPQLYGGLAWIRDHTPTDAVVAVNNQWIDPSHTAPLEFNYSAFSERRVFLEGWGYSQRARDLGYANVVAGVNPFADRLELNRLVFSEADPESIRSMVEDYGVRYLIIDEVNGIPADVEALQRFGQVAYSAPGVLVLELFDP